MGFLLAVTGVYGLMEMIFAVRKKDSKAGTRAAIAIVIFALGSLIFN